MPCWPRFRPQCARAPHDSKEHNGGVRWNIHRRHGKTSNDSNALSVPRSEVHDPIIQRAPYGFPRNRKEPPRPRMRRSHQRCVGCKKKTPQGVVNPLPDQPSNRALQTPLQAGHLARAALERQRPPRTCGNRSRTAARLPGGSIGSTKYQINVSRDWGIEPWGFLIHGVPAPTAGTAPRAEAFTLVRAVVQLAVRSRMARASAGGPTEVPARVREQVRALGARGPRRASPSRDRRGLGDRSQLPCPGACAARSPRWPKGVPQRP